MLRTSSTTTPPARAAVLSLLAMLVASLALVLAGPSGPARAADTWAFSCTGTLGISAPRYAVSGTMAAPNTPASVSVSVTRTVRIGNRGVTSTSILYSAVTPTAGETGTVALAGLLGWNLGTASGGGSSVLWLPAGVPGSSFAGYLSGPSTGVQLNCLAPQAPGLTGTLTCSMGGDGRTYLVNGTIVAPSTPVNVTLSGSISTLHQGPSVISSTATPTADPAKSAEVMSSSWGRGAGSLTAWSLQPLGTTWLVLPSGGLGTKFPATMLVNSTPYPGTCTIS